MQDYPLLSNLSALDEAKVVTSPTKAVRVANKLSYESKTKSPALLQDSVYLKDTLKYPLKTELVMKRKAQVIVSLNKKQFKPSVN